MHIPNGFLSDPVCAVTTLASLGCVGAGAWLARTELNETRARTLAATSAGIFAVQMLNFPIAAGTSGHLIGAAGATILLGPRAAMLAMTLVLVVQAAIFGDGGFTTLGANLLNMAIVAPWAAWGVIRTFGQGEVSASRTSLAAGMAGFVSVLAAALVCSLELRLGGTTSLATVLPTMLQAHLPVALSEGLMTAALALVMINRSTAARIIDTHVSIPAPTRVAGTWGLAIAIALLLAPWASSAPDALESVAQRLGLAATSSYAGLVPDYVFPGVAWEPLAVALAGACGVAVVFLSGQFLARLLARPKTGG